jgi:GT2 family glycosyltransferase
VTKAPRIGVVVLDFGRPAGAERAASSARDPRLDVQVLIVENGSSAAPGARGDHLHLAENRGFAGGMNAGLERLRAAGCEQYLLLNSDAVLEPDCLRRLSAALEDPHLAAVGPVILRAADGRVESRGFAVDLERGRVRIEGQGEMGDDRAGLHPAEGLSGAAILLSRAALDSVGPFDDAYFFSFEDVDWCVRARRAGFGLAVVLGARVRHEGSATIGRASPDRLYYAARNHLRCVEKLEPLSVLGGWRRRCAVLALNLAFALKQSDVARGPACRAVLEGYRDARRGRTGPARL